MKKVMVFLLSIIFISMISALSMTGSAVEGQQKKCENEGGTWKEFNNGCADSCELARQDSNNPIICTQALEMDCDCGIDKCWNGNECENNENSEKNQSPRLIKKENKLMVGAVNQGECPENCTCSGSTTKCEIQGGREMTILAGNSGNMIVQVKGENMSTNVTLYKSEGKIYGIFKNNETKKINMLPDQVIEKLQEKIQQKSDKYNITLDENGMYQVQIEKKSRLFLLFPVRERVKAEISAENGELMRIRNPWWGFLAKDDRELMVGSSCGTVTPGYNYECCQNKGYDYWNLEKEECEFNLEE